MAVDWHAPQARIQVAERERRPFYVPQDRIMRVSYREPHRGSTEMAASLDNSDGVLWYLEPYLRKGAKVNLEFGYPGRMRGPIPLVSTGYPSGGMELEIKARCKADSGSDKIVSRRWVDATIGEVVEKLANERGFSGREVRIDHDPERRESVVQANETDHEFLHRLADLTGRRYWVDEDGWHFEIADKDTEPAAILRHVASAFGPGTFEEYSVAKIRTRVPRKLTLQSYDPLRRKEIRHAVEITDSRLPVLSGDPISSADEDTEAVDRAAEFTDAAVLNEAIGRMREMKLAAVQMEITAAGDPFVRKGKRAIVVDLHELLDGLWHIREVTHEIADGYSSQITLSREGHAKRKRRAKDAGTRTPITDYVREQLAWLRK